MGNATERLGCFDAAIHRQAFCFGMWIEDFAFPVGTTIGIFLGIWSIKFWG